MAELQGAVAGRRTVGYPWRVLWFVGMALVFLVTEIAFDTFVPRSGAALLAILPVGGRTVPLSAAAVRALSRSEDPGGPYRAAPTHGLDATKLGGRGIIETETHSLLFLFDQKRIIGRPRPNSRRGARPIVVIGVRVENDRLVLGGRFWPSPFFFLSAIALAAFAFANVAPALVFAGILLLALLLEGAHARAIVRAAEAEVEVRVDTLARGRAVGSD